MENLPFVLWMLLFGPSIKLERFIESKYTGKPVEQKPDVTFALIVVFVYLFVAWNLYRK